MIGGGFGGLPRKQGAHQPSTLGVYQGPTVRVAPTKIPMMPRGAPLPPMTPTPAEKERERERQKPPAPVPDPIVTDFPKGPDKGDGFPYHVIILSASPRNCSRCIDAVLEKEPKIPAGRIVVVDDGARAGCADVFSGIEWLKAKKPFVFARNSNQGIQWAQTDVILLNDDALLETKGGFGLLHQAVQKAPEYGVIAAGIRGDVGNPNQHVRNNPNIRAESQKLSFICVYIRAETFQKVGLLDERYLDYGYEDDDFCLRVMRAGFKLGIYDPCVVDHSRPETSSFRTKPDISRLITNNRLRFEAKWKGR